jgi:hypothetical protein
VLWSGIALLALVALRAIGLWWSAGSLSANTDHEHEHAHCPDHDHDHGHAHVHHHHEEHSHTIAAHEHTHDCHHAHEHGLAPAHDCGHEHSWNPGRYIVLLLPIVLFFLHLPNAGFSASGISIKADELVQGGAGKYVENTGLQITTDPARNLIQVVSVVADSPAAKAGIEARDWILQLTRDEDDARKKLAQPEVVSLKGLEPAAAVQKLQGKPGSTITLTIERPDGARPQEVHLTRAADVLDLEFNTLQSASYTPLSRHYYEGKIVRLVGQYAPGDTDRTFTLVRFKITCCAADAQPLNVMIMLDPQSQENLSHVKALEWVKVTGRLTFRKRKDRDEYVTVLMVASPSDVKSTEPDPRPYIQ